VALAWEDKSTQQVMEVEWDTGHLSWAALECQLLLSQRFQHVAHVASHHVCVAEESMAAALEVESITPAMEEWEWEEWEV
jgi:hypothetical protein